MRVLWKSPPAASLNQSPKPPSVGTKDSWIRVAISRSMTPPKCKSSCSAACANRSAHRNPQPSTLNPQPSAWQQANERSNSLYRGPVSRKGAPDEEKIFICRGEPFAYPPKMGRYADLHNHLLVAAATPQADEDIQSALDQLPD